MNQRFSQTSGGPHNGGGNSIEALASQALALIKAQHQTHADAPQDIQIQRLASAFIDDDPDIRRTVLADLIASGVHPSTFVRCFAGDIARHLGKLWADNKISFADVTIGTARLQESVRGFCARSARNSDFTDGPVIMLAVPLAENHTLGAIVAAEHFRQLGCRVHLAVGLSDKEISAKVALRGYDMIGVSASSNRTVRAATDLIKIIRKAAHPGTPITIGGGGPELQDLFAETGADHVISDANGALKLCNIGAKRDIPA